MLESHYTKIGAFIRFVTITSKINAKPPDYHWNGSTKQLQATETGFVVCMKEGFKTSTGLDQRIAHKMDLISKWPLKYYWLSDNQLLVVFRRWNHQAADRNVLLNFSVMVLRDCFTFDVVKVEKY